MLFPDEPTIDAVASGFLLATIGLLWVILLVRLNGLRSLSKMTNFDFVMTVAMGSLLAGASQTTEWNDLAQVGAAMIALFVCQNLAARARKSSDAVERFMQNEPVLLMKDGNICHAALRETRVAESDLLAKLREANAMDFSKIKAVVLETTGDVSVLHGNDDLDDRLTQNIRNMTGDD